MQNLEALNALRSGSEPDTLSGKKTMRYHYSVHLRSGHGTLVASRRSLQQRPRRRKFLPTKTLRPILALAVIACLAGAGQVQAAVLAHYSFDADYRDGSGNGADGTLVDVGTAGNSGITTNAGTWVFGGGALTLDAERDYVSVPSRTFSSGTPYSIAFWAKKSDGDTSGAAQWDMVIGQRDNANFFIALNDASGTSSRLGLRWRSSDTTAARNADFVSPNDTNWHHHVITANTTSNIAYYLDGALVAIASNKLTGFIYDTIGEAYSSTSDFDFNGQIDEVWIFNETLGAAAVSNLYSNNSVNGVTPPSNTNLVLHLAFEGDYTDSSGSSNHGTASGGATLTADPLRAAVGAGALWLDGQDASYVALSSNLAFGSANSWTIAFWAQRAETSAQRGMIMGERNTTDDFIWLNDNFSGLRFRSSTAATLDFTVTRDTALHHYALVASGAGTLKLYVDGAFRQTLSGDTSFTLNTLGQAYPTSSLHYAFQGMLDDVRVYDGPLASDAILALYQMGTNVVTNAVTGVTRLHVVLQGGQSNADGRGDPAGLPAALQAPQADIDFYYRETSDSLTTLRSGTSATAQFGPEITCGRGYADLLGAQGSNRVAIIKYARGGSSLNSDWKPGGDATTSGDGPDYVIFQQTVANGLAALRVLHPGAVISIDGMTWMQGESDDSAASTYQTNLAAFIADVRATFQPNLPFIIARLSAGQTAVGNLATLRAAQAAVAAADPWAALVDTDSFPVKSSDHLHFDAAGQQMLGYAFAYKLGYLQDLTNRFSTAQINAGLAAPGADADGDGASNEAEFIAGTDATNALSLLKAQITPAAPGVFNVSYPTAQGRRYSVEWLANLAGTNWTMVLPAGEGTGAGATRSFTNEAGAGFIRVRATLP